MLIDEVAAGIFGAIFRFLSRIFFEVIIEILIKGLGHFVCRPFKKVDIDSAAAVIVGLITWVIIIIMVILTYDWLSKSISIDSCLDDGGRYNYETSICEYK